VLERLFGRMWLIILLLSEDIGFVVASAYAEHKSNLGPAAFPDGLFEFMAPCKLPIFTALRTPYPNFKFIVFTTGCDNVSLSSYIVAPGNVSDPIVVGTVFTFGLELTVKHEFSIILLPDLNFFIHTCCD